MSPQLRQKRTIAIVATTLASVVARLSALVSQVIVGWYLTEEQVGTFAVAIGIMGVTALFRNGGIAFYFPTLKPDAFEAYAGRLFWWGMLFSAIGCAGTFGAALGLPWATTWFDSAGLPGLGPVLILLGVRNLVAPIAMLGRMRMSVLLQFTQLARLDVANAILRLGLTLLCAQAGMGAMALAIAFCSQLVIEATYCTIKGKVTWSNFHWNAGMSMGQMLRLMKWPIAISVLVSLSTQLNFLVLGIAIPASTLGLFYFAFQLANQPTMLLTSALQNVLAPFLARDRGNQVAEQLGMERVFAGALLFVPITTVATASFFPTLELLVWGGKWSAINGGLYFLCIGATYATIAGILTGPLLGLQRFKAVAGFEVGKMAGTIGGAVLGALVVWLDSTNDTPRYEPITVICITTGAAMTIASLAQLVWIMRQYRVSPRDMVQHLTFGPALALLTALAAQSIGHSIRESMALSEGRLGAGLEFIAVATIYCTLIILGVRFTAEETLRATVDVLPAPARRFLQRVFVLD
jgi:O-antigen/teichoic acid export membrane protein